MKLVRYRRARPRKARHHRQRGAHPRPVGRGSRHRRRRALAEGPRQDRQGSSRTSCRWCAATPRIGPCVGKVGNFIAIGLNYADHAAEAGMPLPKEPIIFNKAPSCICGPERRHHDPEGLDQARLRGRARHRDRQPRALSRRRASAIDAVAGYCLANDVSERAVPDRARRPVDQGQGLRDVRPDRPLARHQGRDPDPQKLDMWLTVNGETRQKGSTKTMIFGVAHIVWYCSQFMVLRAGRRHHHRHAARRRHRHEARAEVPQGRRRREARHRRARRADAEGRALQVVIVIPGRRANGDPGIQSGASGCLPVIRRPRQHSCLAPLVPALSALWPRLGPSQSPHRIKSPIERAAVGT